MKGLRYGKWKMRLDLIPALWTWALGNVLTRGAIKYRDHNWMGGMPWNDVLGPMKRHLTKWEAGEVYDKDTGCHHLAMVAWNALALMFYQLMGLGTNNTKIEFTMEVKAITGDTLAKGEFKPADSHLGAFDLVNNLPMEIYVNNLIDQGVLNEDGSQKTRDEQLDLEDKVLIKPGDLVKVRGGVDGIFEPED